MLANPLTYSVPITVLLCNASNSVYNLPINANLWGMIMDWVRILAYITGTVDQELLLRNEYLAAENRIRSSPRP
jgi:hypothetical protein